MSQQGQLVKLKTSDQNGSQLWAYRYRSAGRGSRRIQRGGFASEREAREALRCAIERTRRKTRSGTCRLTLSELVEVYLAQHDVDPATSDKLCWALGKAVATFGGTRVDELRSQEIAAWRMTIPAGHRFDATQALRQLLARAVVWELIDVNPAKRGVENPQRRRREMRPFESWSEIKAVAAQLGPRYGPMVVFVAATGLRPGEWIALERRDIDRDARVAYIRRAFINGRVKCTKTEASKRAVPLQTAALAALDRLPTSKATPLLFPSPRGHHLNLRNFRNRDWKPAQTAAGIEPLRRIYDLRHTFATFALRAGISTFDLSRYMGASLTMIERHYGHLARDAHEHAIRQLDAHTSAQTSTPVDVGGHFVDTARTPQHRDHRETAR